MVVGGVPLTGTDGMKETIRIARETGIRVVGSHIKAKGMDMWGQAALDVLRIDRARQDGVQVYLDQYPYETFGGGLTDIIPVWAYAPPPPGQTGVAGSTIRVGDGSRQRQWKILPATWLIPPFARISLRTASISSA